MIAVTGLLAKQFAELIYIDLVREAFNIAYVPLLIHVRAMSYQNHILVFLF